MKTKPAQNTIARIEFSITQIEAMFVQISEDLKLAKKELKQARRK